MNTLALKGVSRQWVAKLHRWSGLALLVVLFIVGVTGAVLAFRWEIDRAINPHLFTVPPQAQSLPYAALIDGVESKYPQALVTTVITPKSPSDAAIMYVKSRMEAHVAHVHVMGMKGSVDFNQIFVNPYTAEVLGQRSTTRFIPTWENFVPDVVRLHFALFMDELGAWILGISALLWFATTFVGLWLTWPTTWRSISRWLALTKVRIGKGGYKFNYDLHRSASLVTLPILVVVAFTSVYLNLPVMIKPVVKAFSPATGTTVIPTAGAMELSAPRVTAEQVITSAQQAFPAGRVQSVGRDFIKGLYSVRVQLPGDVSPTGNTTLYFGMADGKVVYVRKLSSGSSGDVFQAWMYPLHTGKAFGLLGQCLVLLGALVLVLTCVTGLNVWLRKRRSERAFSYRQRVEQVDASFSVKP